MASKTIDKQVLAAAVLQLRHVVDRFIAAAESDAPTSRMKMLEESVGVGPAMEAVVKAKTGTT